MRRTHLLAAATVASICLAPAIASAATYQVGPGRAITQLEELSESLQPGDVVELDGDATYTGDVWMEANGTASAPVTIRGIPVNGKRPIISGGDYTMIIRGGHWILENLDVTGGAEVCLFQKAADLTVRDSIVRDCDKHGVLGADLETGNLLLQRVEVTRTGFDIYKHQVYVATDEGNFPGSVFRMEGCWIHDANGGINIKSRAERVELYGNWIEGAQFHELDLVGNQEYPAELVREDSDVVGNVIVKAPGNQYTIARVGGDGTGNTQGRHRFANNTMILSDATQYGFRLGGELESFELHNNVIHGNGSTQLWREEYVGTMSVSGTSNWMSQGINLPDDRVAGIRGSDPGFVGGGDYRLASGSPLLDAATPSPSAPPGLAVPGAQGVPTMTPIIPGVQQYGSRGQSGGLDIGAFEHGGSNGGAPPPPPPPPPQDDEDPTTTTGSGDPVDETAGAGGGDEGEGGSEPGDDDGTVVPGSGNAGNTGTLENLPQCSFGGAVPHSNAGLALSALAAMVAIGSRRRKQG